MTQALKTILAIDTETRGKNPHRADLIGISLYHDRKSSWHSGKTVMIDMPDAYVIGQNAKFDAVILARYGIRYHVNYDTMLAEYLLHIDQPRKLEVMYERYFGEHKKDLLEIFNDAQSVFGIKERKRLPDDWYETSRREPSKNFPHGKVLHIGVAPEVLASYAKEDVEATFKIYQAQMKEFETKPELYKWFMDVEMPVCNILIQSEIKGVKLDVAKLQLLETELQAKADGLYKKIEWLSGTPGINLNSPKQLQEVMFKKLHLPRLTKTQTGWSTSKATLEKMKDRAFPKLLLQYNECDDLLSKFIRPLPLIVDKDSRLHTTFNQALTDTRRFSSEDPNLQNIPAKTDLGRRIRECFVPEEGHKFLICDYSQIEPRLLAHFSSDPFLLEAFNTDKDLYEFVSSLMSKRLGRDFSRSMAKILVLSLIYGKTAYGLALDWRITQAEAQSIIDQFYGLFTKVREWMQDTVTTSKFSKSWGKSLAGLPLKIVAKGKDHDVIGDLDDERQWVQEACQRLAVNYPIQSSSQDIIKKAMVNVYEKFGLVFVLQVHDELVYEVPTANAEAVEKAIVYEMEHAWELKVPIKVSHEIADYWKKG